MSTRHPFRALALALALLAVAPGLRAGAPDLAAVLPGRVHLGALADVELLVRDFPEVLERGALAESIDAWVARGYPDPRGRVGAVAIGADVEGRRLRDLFLVGAGSLRLEEPVRRLAERARVPVREHAYRGVTFVEPELPGPPLAFADLRDDLAFVSWDRKGIQRTGIWTVDTMHGRIPDVRETHGLELGEDTYMVGALRIPLAARRALVARSPGLAGLELVAQGSVVWRRDGGMVRVGSVLRTFTSIEARLLARQLRRRRDALVEEVDDPRLKDLLRRIEIVRDGRRVTVRLDLAWTRARASLPALLAR